MAILVSQQTYQSSPVFPPLSTILQQLLGESQLVSRKDAFCTPSSKSGVYSNTSCTPSVWLGVVNRSHFLFYLKERSFLNSFKCLHSLSIMMGFTFLIYMDLSACSQQKVTLWNFIRTSSWNRLILLHFVILLSILAGCLVSIGYCTPTYVTVHRAQNPTQLNSSQKSHECSALEQGLIIWRGLIACLEGDQQSWNFIVWFKPRCLWPVNMTIYYLIFSILILLYFKRNKNIN